MIYAEQEIPELTELAKAHIKADGRDRAELFGARLLVDKAKLATRESRSTEHLVSRILGLFALYDLRPDQKIFLPADEGTPNIVLAQNPIRAENIAAGEYGEDDWRPSERMYINSYGVPKIELTDVTGKREVTVETQAIGAEVWAVVDQIDDRLSAGMPIGVDYAIS